MGDSDTTDTMIRGMLAATMLTLMLATSGFSQQQRPAPGTDWLVASAVLAAPAALREGAEVRGWTADDDLVVLRAGTNDVICRARHRLT